MVVCGLLVEICFLVSFSNMIVFSRKEFTRKSFFETCDDNEKPKKIWKKGVGKGHVVQPNETGWDRLEYVEYVEQGQGGLLNWWNRGIFKFGGTGWKSGQVFVQLSLSTCSNVGLQGRTIFIHTILLCVCTPALTAHTHSLQKACSCVMVQRASVFLHN